MRMLLGCYEETSPVEFQLNTRRGLYLRIDDKRRGLDGLLVAD